MVDYDLHVGSPGISRWSVGPSDSVGLTDSGLFVITSGGGGGFTKPTTTNTGPRIALTTHTGNYAFTADNQSISGLNITGDLAQGPYKNVSATDCKIAGTCRPATTSGGAATAAAQNLTLTYCDVGNVYNTSGFNGFYCYNSRFRGFAGSTTMQLTVDNPATYTATNLILSSCYFDAPGHTTGATHLEAVHLMGVTHALIQGCWLNYQAPDSATSTYITAQINCENYNGGDCQYIKIDSNWISANPAIGTGNYYQIYMAAKNSAITNNLFDGRAMGNLLYPPSSYPPPPLPAGGVYPTFTQSGNTYDATQSGIYLPATLPES